MISGSKSTFRPPVFSSVLLFSLICGVWCGGALLSCGCSVRTADVPHDAQWAATLFTAQDESCKSPNGHLQHSYWPSFSQCCASAYTCFTTMCSGFFYFVHIAFKMLLVKSFYFEVFSVRTWDSVGGSSSDSMEARLSQGGKRLKAKFAKMMFLW